MAAIVAVAVFACGHVASGARTACGPFGDAPVKVLGAVKPECGAGQLLGPWRDSEGTAHYACLFEPDSASPKNKLPLLVFLHPSLFDAATVGRTGLLKMAATYPLSGDPKRPGFLVLALQGRRTSHFYPFPDNRGSGWDNWYRQLSPDGSVKVGGKAYPENVDAAAIDHFVMQVAQAGKVDTRRIYLTGWSNGASMAMLYALDRPDIAAAAVYSGPDPFGAFNDPCSQTPVAGTPANDKQIRIFNPRVPIMHVHNSCDIGGTCPNAERLAKELRAAGVSIEDVIIDGSGRRVDACWSWCGTSPDAYMNLLSCPIGWTLGLYHHSRWPTEWNRAMLDFLRGHPLHPAGVPF